MLDSATLEAVCGVIDAIGAALDLSNEFLANQTARFSAAAMLAET